MLCGRLRWKLSKLAFTTKLHRFQYLSRNSFYSSRSNNSSLAITGRRDTDHKETCNSRPSRYRPWMPRIWISLRLDSHLRRALNKAVLMTTQTIKLKTIEINANFKTCSRPIFGTRVPASKFFSINFGPEIQNSKFSASIFSTTATHFPQDCKNMRSMRSTSRKSASSAEKVLPKDDVISGNISKSGDYQHPEHKHCSQMSVPVSQPKNSCHESFSEPQAPGKTSLVKSSPRSFWFNKLLFSLLGFCAPISYIPECGQPCKPIMLCLPGPPEIAGKKEEKEDEELKPIGLITRNKEADFIGGKFIAGCTCGRKNGLQGDCPRISCRNNPGCTMNPPRCWPQFKVKPKPVPPPDQKMVCVPIQLVYYDPYNC